MFGKTNPPPKRAAETAAASEPAARKAALPASLLGQGLVFDGQVSGEGEVHIDGEVRGDILAPRVVVGEGAVVTGSIKGEQVAIRGRVAGSIEAHSVKLYETARVEGDLVYDLISIDAGARFEGRCRPAAAKPTAEVIELETAVAG